MPDIEQYGEKLSTARLTWVCARVSARPLQPQPLRASRPIMSAAPVLESSRDQPASKAVEAPATASPTAVPTPTEPPREVGALEPLRQPLFRALWGASLISNIGTWMQTVGGAWLMTSLTDSPLPVALMQTATSLPIFLLGLPAGALADLVDRRRLLLIAQAWMLAVAAAIGALTVAEVVNPVLLLLATFSLGIGTAFTAPAWQATVPEVVAPRQMASAVALEAAGFNVARAVGPALGGVVVATLGPGANFFLNAASFLATIVVLARWRRQHRESELPGERLLSATKRGLRYAGHAPELRAVLVRCGAFMSCASALWALLPAVARRDLGLESSGYGILMGALGTGAVAGAWLLPRLRERIGVDRRLLAASVVFALATLALGSLPNVVLLSLVLLVGGVAWMVAMSALTVAAQACAPKWVKARALGTYLLVMQGVLAAGSILWGAVAGVLGSSLALGLAAGGLVVGAVGTARWRLEPNECLDLTPSRLLPKPEVEEEAAPDPEEGPVMITAEYRVRLDQCDAFVRAMREVGRVRRRDGAIRWGLFRDPAVPGRYMESFIAESWIEYQRQLERATVADRAIEDRARGFLEANEPTVTHLVAARPSGTDEPCTDGV